MLDQQLAATLQAGSATAWHSPRALARGRSCYRVSGVALVTSPEVLFQPLNPQLGPAPAQPPAQIAILPLATFANTLAPQLRTLSPASIGASAVPGAQDGVQWQVQAQIAATGLGSSPGQALVRAGQIKNSVERTLPGQVQFVDNLGESLNTAAGDALYAETLYVMLAVPGALIALGLAYLAALGTVERDRRELSLLRARGGSRRSLVGFALVESVVVGLLAGAVGAGVAALAVLTLVPGTPAFTVGRTLATLALSIVVATIGAAAARIGASERVFARNVSEGRRGVGRPRQPLWQRLYLDVLALGVSGLIYWLTARTGFSAVVNPDSNPTLSLSIYMFFAPALLWIGATLLLVRARGRAVTLLLSRRAGRRATTVRGFLLASAGRRGPALNRGLVLVGLLLAFGVNLGIFTATYNQQARIDAQLTVGADVVTTAPPGVATSRNLAATIARVPGVVATSALDHSYVYVGTRPAGHLRHRRDHARASNNASRLVLPRRYRFDDALEAALPTRCDPRLQGDDHRLLARRGRPAQAARPRPLDRPVSRRALPRRRHRRRVSVRAEGLVHGHQRGLPAGRDARRWAERGVREDER